MSCYHFFHHISDISNQSTQGNLLDHMIPSSISGTIRFCQVLSKDGIYFPIILVVYHQIHAKQFSHMLHAEFDTKNNEMLTIADIGNLLHKNPFWL